MIGDNKKVGMVLSSFTYEVLNLANHHDKCISPDLSFPLRTDSLRLASLLHCMKNGLTAQELCRWVT